MHGPFEQLTTCSPQQQNSSGDVMRTIAPILLLVLCVGPCLGGDPVVIRLPEKQTVRTSVVTIGDIATLTGGTIRDRQSIARLDIAEMGRRGETQTISRRAIESRTALAGFDPRHFTVTGANRTTLGLERRPITPDEVVAAARDEVIRQLPVPPGSVQIDLVQPVVVSLPEVPIGETVTIKARPRTKILGVGRVQMDVTITHQDERILALPVYFDIKPQGSKAGPGTQGQPNQANEILVRPRQRVTMVATIGEVRVTAMGEAQQGGRQGDAILVQNVDSKKLLTARVTGPATVEVDLGGGKP